MAQGITGFAAGRASPSPVVRLFSFLTDRSRVRACVTVDGLALRFEEIFTPVTAVAPATLPLPAHAINSADTVTVPLLRVAHGRSGDKGDMANIGIIARSDALYAVLQQNLTADKVRNYLAHVAQGKVSRYSLPGLNALNFTLENALGGGGVASLSLPSRQFAMKTVMDYPSELDTEALATNPAGKQTPRRMRRAAEIINAARETFLEKGFERASVSEIAAKVGVVEGLLYSYFPT
eukprot:gene28707-50584_t